MPSAVRPEALFVPDLAPPPLFFGISAGGESVVGGTGVALDSDAFSEELLLLFVTGGGGMSARTGVEAVDGADLSFEFFRGADLGANLLSLAGLSLNMMIFDGLFIFLNRGVDVEETVVVVVDMLRTPVQSYSGLVPK